MKIVKLNEHLFDELNQYAKVDTNSYRYMLFRSLNGDVIAKRIRREYIGTIASAHDATPENPNGWERVEIFVKRGEHDD